MGKNFTAVFAVCLAISALPLACGDDEEPSNGGGGKGGSAGKGGKGGTSGTSGTSGKGGTSGTAGTGARGGTSGQGGTSTGGTMPGGAGGGGGDEGGNGGAGGDDNPMTACGRLCERAEAANCPDNSTCQYDMCDALLGYGCDAEVAALVDCGADNASPASFSCTKDDRPEWNGSVDCPTEYEAFIYCFLP